MTRTVYDGYPLVATRNFIQATRDSGYKSTSSALAELVDNSLEANASCVEIRIETPDGGELRSISVSDNGIGMPPPTLQLALQFGGSTRFNSRRGFGRYGMGLPNSSLSQARRVDVYSWQNPNSIWSTYLDVDEIASGKLLCVPPPVRIRPGSPSEYPNSPTGTVVHLSRCDRLNFKTLRPLTRKLHADLGRIFRKQLYQAKTLTINGVTVQPFDPLFVDAGANLWGAANVGPPLSYQVSSPNGGGASEVVVRFSILPMEEWHSLSNAEKNRAGIAKGAGVSVVRGGREIDYGWYFMGTKRKENYDDWWRCEVCFDPDLDDLFGVTHTKQRVNPTEELRNVLTPDLERIARELNNQIRKRYLQIRGQALQQMAAQTAEGRDGRMEPIKLGTYKAPRRGITGGYRIESKPLDDVCFYLPTLSGNKLSLVLNREHNFYQRVYEPLSLAGIVQCQHVLEHIQLLLLAAARAECALQTENDKNAARRLREYWSNALTAFLD
jgi:Histidine kinase-, DNA gyrase B-, and HSP90-like ATPase